MPESDPNVIYGGDASEYGPIDGGCATVGELIAKSLKEGGNRRAFINGSSNKILTFNDILDQSLKMAKVLHEIGLRKNDVISIVAENRQEYTAIAFGALFLNAIVAPVNVTYTERELQHAFELSKPKLVFVAPIVAKKTATVCRKLNYIQRIILLEGSGIDNFIVSLSSLVKKYEKSDYDVSENFREKINLREQVGLIFCSSGTTGMPKGVLITHENLMAVVQTYKGRLNLIKKLHDIKIISFNIAPWFHVLGFVSMFMFACSSESVFVYLPKFEEKKFYEAVQKYKVNFAIIVPPIMVLLAKSPLFEKYDLSSIQDISCGAAALSKELEDKVRERFKGNVTIRQGYGMSETTYGVLAALEIIKPGSVGEVLKGVYAKIIDESGKSLGPYQRGELCFKGDRIMRGYINDPRATNEAIDADGWLHSGDVAYYDDDKQFFIVDRLKELIKYKGFQVPPAEVEGLLLSHPKIKDCGVIGIPDESSGELPLAYVVKQPGEDLTEQEVFDFVAEHASKPKWLRGGVKFIKEIPKNPSGKILRRQLRDFYKNTKSKL